MPNYNNSIPFDSNKWSDMDNVDEAVRHIASDIYLTGKIKRWHNYYTEHLKHIVLNLYVNYTIDPEMYTAYSRNKTKYGGKKRNNSIHLRYDSMIKMIDILWKDLGYIEGTIGFYFPDKERKRNARMRATDKLLKTLFVDY